ncbi:cytokine receptor common subunit gamma-like [Cololabis saira]|uniref:cytokine receptor common subunit gamma-like n=1 Tax=Cololabis saira TaxID=129043 RepID=UPI002AD2C059|nr:cytokine receptor common subunit gamma-like [Cololabis saira]
MSTALLLFLCLIGHVFAKEPPDVQCLIVHLQYVSCSWNKSGTPAVNYTFSSWFEGGDEIPCGDYLRENNLNTGCNRPCNRMDGFDTFYTVLSGGNKPYRNEHKLKDKVKLNPPTNLTVQMGADSNLWFYWNQTSTNCVDSEVQFRKNKRKWENSPVVRGRQSYCINLPSSSFQYELKVRSQLSHSCGGSLFWSDWSEPVVWGSNNSTDVQCLIVHQQYVSCSWNKSGTPAGNYTFSSWFHDGNETDCSDYLRENNMITGCNRPCNASQPCDRFRTFYTVLSGGNKPYRNTHTLKDKVKLNPPTNLTVQMGADSNLWFYWNQTFTSCVDSEVQFRKNKRKWENSKVLSGRQSYCINLPSSSFQYELQVRSQLSDYCGGSLFWSDWSEPVVWGSNNSTDSYSVDNSMSVWTPVLYAVGALVLILLALMLVQNERLRIILIPVLPKPSLDNIEDWFQLSKGLKEDSQATYNERACPVREYIYISPSDNESSDSSDSSDSSGLSVTTDQTDCSVSIAVNDQEDPSTAFSSSKMSTEND